MPATQQVTTILLKCDFFQLISLFSIFNIHFILTHCIVISYSSGGVKSVKKITGKILTPTVFQTYLYLFLIFSK